MHKLIPILYAVAALGMACEGATTGLSHDGGPMAPPTCADDTFCPIDQHCDDATKLCVAGTGNACINDQMCPDGQQCDVKTCSASRCHGNVCIPIACANDSTCPEGFMCDGTSLICVPGTATSTCTGDRDCRATMGAICRANKCVPGTSCTESSMCPMTERCIRDFCRPPCATDQDCGGMIFRCDTGTGECQNRCLGDGTCPMGKICEMNLCVDSECTENADCGSPTRRCAGLDRGHGRCEDFTVCDPVNPMCPPNQRCGSSGECEELPECVGDRDCDPDEFCESSHCQPAMGCAAMTCPSGFDCVANRCVPGPCRGLDDCTAAGEICVAGVCQMPPPPSFVTEVRILTPAGVVRPGSTYPMVAVALDQAGDVVPGVTFVWASTSSAVASINGSGVATGGARAGTTDITASVVSPGQGTITSPPVRLVNVGPLPAGRGRVTVISQASGNAVVGATVIARQGTTDLPTVVTDTSGTALIASVDPMAAIDVTVADAAHDWVTVIGSTALDLVITLPPITRADRAGGLKGGVDLSSVHSSGAFAFSVSGASFPSPLVGTDAAALFGGDLMTVRQMFGGRAVNIPLPAGSTLEIELLGNPFSLKDTYYAPARTGLRAAWSFGGKQELNLTGAGAGGFGDVLGLILPYFQRFDHDVRPSLRVLEIPKVVDTADTDGDSNTTEEVPDWSRFPTVAMRPDVAQSLRVELVVAGARLPFVDGSNANALVVVSGTLLPGIGFVPLGLDGLQDDQNRGVVPSFTTRIAPAHGGLEIGEYAVLALAFRNNPGQIPRPGSAQVFTSATLPTSVDFTGGWLDSPENVALTRSTRVLSMTAGTSGDMIRVNGRAPSGGWQVWAPSGMAASIVLPAVPVLNELDRLTALTASVSVEAIDLGPGIDPRTLFDVARGGAIGIDRATRGYARGSVTTR